MPALVLASQSPRRVELIAHLVADYGLAPSGVEDEGSDAFPEWELPALALPSGFTVPQEAHPTLWAWRKAVDAALHAPSIDDDAVVLGADTVMVGPGMLLGKPKDDADALYMLQSLRAKRHFVVTGHALARKNGEKALVLHAGVTISAVWMRDYSDVELKGYVATGESLDKAGAYALQGLGGRLVDRIEDCYTNIVGLPLCDLRRALEVIEVELLPYPEGGYCANCPLHGTKA